ncbi:MAG: hypothetical protein H7Z41_03365 [Cytophagales bacterium]|nr:hypothetical protein [Armatimonadota bacterium]
MRKPVFVGTCILCLLGPCLLGYGCSIPPAPAASALPEITTFLNQHQEFGSIVSVQREPDWSHGKRQRVNLSSGRKLLFYIRSGSVVTVYEQKDASGRTLLWGESQ